MIYHWSRAQNFHTILYDTFQQIPPKIIFQENSALIFRNYSTYSLKIFPMVHLNLSKPYSKILVCFVSGISPEFRSKISVEISPEIALMKKL